MSQTAEQKAAADKAAADKAAATKTAADKKAADKAAADKAAADKLADDKAAAATQQADRDAEELTDGVKVQFLRSHPAFGYFAGEKGTISKQAFEKYSQDGEFFKKL